MKPNWERSAVLSRCSRTDRRAHCQLAWELFAAADGPTQAHAAIGSLRHLLVARLTAIRLPERSMTRPVSAIRESSLPACEDRRNRTAKIARFAKRKALEALALSVDIPAPEERHLRIQRPTVFSMSSFARDPPAKS